MLTRNAGFTLIELLVAITIVAIISSIGFVTYGSAQITARDSRRIQDLNTISIALELYRQANGRYPCETGGAWVYSTSGGFWITDAGSCGTSKTLDSTYINVMPVDPRNNSAPPWTATKFSFAYHANAAADCGTLPAGQSYQLMTQLENAADAKSCQKVDYKDCNGVSFCTPFNASGIALPMYIITK